jgi:dCMP deaminase
MNWNEYFIEMLDSIKQKSKDRSTKVGAIIVGEHNNILTTGFNGFARGVAEDVNDLSSLVPPHIKIHREEEINERHQRPQKYLWTEHAERNAIYNAARHGIALEGSTIYIDWYPCSRCARAIIQSGIKSIVIDGRNCEEKTKYWEERWKDDMEVSRTMLDEAKVSIVIYKKE